jgi:hypothetical protein
MDPEIAFRLLLTALLSILPTLLFLGLWRGLSKLRDDDLLDRVETAHGVDPRPDPRAMVPGVSTGEGSVGRCRYCGTAIAPNESVCKHCG